jgi:hypothetical protein
MTKSTTEECVMFALGQVKNSNLYHPAGFGQDIVNSQFVTNVAGEPNTPIDK